MVQYFCDVFCPLGNLEIFMNKKVWQRFEELAIAIDDIEKTKQTKQEKTILAVINDSYETEEKTYIDNNLLLQWEIQVEDLFTKVVDKESIYYKQFKEKKESTYNEYSIFQDLKVIFLTFKNDYKKGYLSSIKTLVQAEVFESQLEQSQELLDNGYKLASAVIAGIVLETGLREICSRENILHGKLDKMNADLAKKGIYNKLQQKRITALADIRNSAAHGKDNEFTKEDVQKMIRDIEDFLAKYLDDA